MRARLASSLTPAQCIGAAEAGAAAACRDSEGATVSSRWVQPTPGPQLYSGGQGAELHFNAHSLLFFWTLLQIHLALFYPGPEPVRIILNYEFGLLSSDRDIPKARQKECRTGLCPY